MASGKAWSNPLGLTQEGKGKAWSNALLLFQRDTVFIFFLIMSIIQLWDRPSKWPNAFDKHSTTDVWALSLFIWSSLTVVKAHRGFMTENTPETHLTRWLETNKDKIKLLYNWREFCSLELEFRSIRIQAKNIKYSKTANHKTTNLKNNNILLLPVLSSIKYPYKILPSLQVMIPIYN